MKRRKFLGDSAKIAGGIGVVSSFPIFNIISRQQPDKLGVALVGLGGYATGQLAPALQETSNCYLAGIVTGTPSKADSWSDRYDIPESNIYNYDNYDEITDNEDIDVIYVVLPNSMHAEYAIRAAQAGKHVISEKPMTTKYSDAVKMMDAVKKAGKSLSVGYRLHFEPYNLEVMRLGQKEVYGKVIETESGFAFPLRDKTRWRLDKEMAGGGPLMDVGIYAIQSTIYTLGELPVSLQAVDKTKDKEFYGDVEGTLEITFKFPSGVKNLVKSSYEENYNYTSSKAENGNWKLQPAFNYNRLRGETHLGPMDFPNVNQQARQLDSISQSIMNGEKSIVPGEMGARDIFILNKVYESMYSGKEVSLKGMPEILHLV